MSTKDVKLAHKWVEQADEILITASNGLAISEELNLFANDQKLKLVLGNLVYKYNLTNLLHAFSFPYKDPLDYWRVVARIAEFYNYKYEASSYMKQIKELIANRPYFIWTSNTDHHFVQAGLNQIFEVEGNWLTGICTNHPETHGTFDLTQKLHEIYKKDQAKTLNIEDLPKCDKCGSSISLNVAGQNYQPDKDQINNFRHFLANSENKNLLVLELGIGPQNQLIKQPSMELVASKPNSHYITINKGQLNIPPEIAGRTVGFSSSIEDAFKEIITGKSYGAQTQGPNFEKQPKLTQKQYEEQEKMMQKFYPNYMVDSAFHGSYPMYITLDKEHPALLHGSEVGQSWMYSIGDSAKIHCFTPDGQYYTVELGLNKNKDQVHGVYINPGTLIAIEANNESAGFSQISTNLPLNNSGRILLPKIEKLIERYPEQKDIIERLAFKED